MADDVKAQAAEVLDGLTVFCAGALPDEPPLPGRTTLTSAGIRAVVDALADSGLLADGQVLHRVNYQWVKDINCHVPVCRICYRGPLTGCELETGLCEDAPDCAPVDGRQWNPLGQMIHCTKGLVSTVHFIYEDCGDGEHRALAVEAAALTPRYTAESLGWGTGWGIRDNETGDYLQPRFPNDYPGGAEAAARAEAARLNEQAASSCGQYTLDGGRCILPHGHDIGHRSGEAG